MRILCAITREPRSVSNFFQSAEQESTHVHVVFDIAKVGFDVRTTLLARGNALLGEQVFLALLAICSELDTDLNVSGALGFGTL